LPRRSLGEGGISDLFLPWMLDVASGSASGAEPTARSDEPTLRPGSGLRESVERVLPL